MHSLNENVPIIRTPTQRMAELKACVSGTMKRHDALGRALISVRKMSAQGMFTNATIIDVLSRKLKASEGFIINHTMYSQLLGYPPTELNVADLQFYADNAKLTLAPLYQKTEKGAIALFIIIHRHAHLAIEYSDELKNIITSTPKSNNLSTSFIKAALKVSEKLGGIAEKNKEILLQDVISTVQTLTDDEAYLISMNYCMAYRLDPRILDERLREVGFETSLLKKEGELKETIEAYRFYENFIGIVVSKSKQGITNAHDNLQILFKVCEAAEAGLPKIPSGSMGLENVG